MPSLIVGNYSISSDTVQGFGLFTWFDHLPQDGNPR